MVSGGPWSLLLYFLAIAWYLTISVVYTTTKFIGDTTTVGLWIKSGSIGYDMDENNPARKVYKGNI